MITYDYQCQACEHSFEKMLPSEDRKIPENEPCPVCGAMEVKRVFVGSPSFQDPAKLGRQKPDNEFRNLLGKIKKDYRGSGNIERYT